MRILGYGLFASLETKVKGGTKVKMQGVINLCEVYQRSNLGNKSVIEPKNANYPRERNIADLMICGCTMKSMKGSSEYKIFLIHLISIVVSRYFAIKPYRRGVQPFRGPFGHSTMLYSPADNEREFNN